MVDRTVFPVICCYKHCKMLPDLYNIFVYLLKYNEAVYTLAPKSEDNKRQSQIFKILNASKRQKLYLVTGEIGEMKKTFCKVQAPKKRAYS